MVWRAGGSISIEHLFLVYWKAVHLPLLLILMQDVMRRAGLNPTDVEVGAALDRAALDRAALDRAAHTGGSMDTR